MTDRSKPIAFCLGLFVLTLFVYSQGLFLHGLEYRDDEIFYYKSTQEMIASGDYLSPKYFQANRFEKPILYYWFILLGYKIFGFGWFGARFFSAVLAAGSVVLTWLTARDLFKERNVAHLSALIVMSIPLFVRHARNAVPDMALNFFIVLACYFAVQYFFKEQRVKYSLMFFVSCALGFMIKGFAAFIAPIGTVLIFGVLKKKFRALKGFGFLRGLGVMLVIILPWFLYMMARHGMPYFDHMVSDETAYRLMGVTEDSALSAKAKSFIHHIGFYSYVLLTFFAPWGLLIFPVLGLTFFKRNVGQAQKSSFQFLTTWFVVVFVFFSFMYFTITHYILVLSTPFAILLSYFLIHRIEGKAFVDKAFRYLAKSYLLLALGLIFIAVSFIMAFVMSLATGWVVLILGAGLALIFFAARSRNPMTAPAVLAICLLFVFSQSQVQANLGLSTMSTLQEFARYIHQQDTGEYSIVVGSNDIHEKELQAYFERRIRKPAEWHVEATAMKLKKIFAEERKVYGLMTASDFERFLADHPQRERIEIVKKQDMIRKRFYLDEGFLRALMVFDKPAIHDYLYEEVYLIKRDEN